LVKEAYTGWTVASRQLLRVRVRVGSDRHLYVAADRLGLTAAWIDGGSRMAQLGNGVA
jgi:hypothetical protein